MQRFVLVHLAVSLGLLAAGTPTAAQEVVWPPPVSFAIRGEFALPLGEFASSLGQDVGFGVGVMGRARLNQRLSIYAGWDQFRFDGAAGNTSFRLRDSGFRGGVQVTASPLVGGWVVPFGLGGASYSRIAIDRTQPTEMVRYRSGFTAGYEMGGGVALTITDRFWFVPEVRYRSRLDDVEAPLVAAATTPVNYLGINLGLLIRIP